MTLKNSTWFLLSLIPILFYFGTFGVYATNIPFYDDYQSLLESTYLLNEAKGASEKLRLLFRFHNEHRIVFSRLIGWIYSFWGPLNMKVLQLIGNLSFLVLFILLGKSAKKKAFYLIISLFIFQFQSWDNAFWTMTSLLNFWVYVWAFAALMVLDSNHRYKLYFAITFGFIATFTIGNGLFVFPVGTLVLVLRKEYKNATVWLISGGILIGFYLIGINEVHPAQPNAAFQRSFLNLIQFFFAFVGSNFWVPVSKYISMCFGAFFALSFFVFLALKYQKKNLSLLSFLAFLLLTAAVVTWNRYLIGVEIPMSSRYRIGGTLIALLVIIIWLDVLIEKLPASAPFLLFFAIIGAAGFNVVSNYMYFNRIVELKDNRLLEAWLSETQHRISGHYKPKEAYQILTKAKEKGIYKMPQINPEVFFYEPEKPIKLFTQNIDYQIDSIIVSKKFTTIEGWAVAPKRKDNLSQIFLVLKTKNQPEIVLKTVQMKRYDLIKNEAKPLNYIESGFMAFIPSSLHKGQKYNIGIAIKPKTGQAGFVMTEKVLN